MKRIISFALVLVLTALLVSMFAFSCAADDTADTGTAPTDSGSAELPENTDEASEKTSGLDQTTKDAILVVIAVLLAAVPSGIGSAIGVGMGGIASAGVTSEKPELFGKLLVLQALPGTQGIYGFLTAVLILVNSGLFSGTLNVAAGGGWKYLIAALPIGIVGLFSAIHQAKVGVAGIHMTAKEPETSGKGVTMAALVETYAILALLVSILLVFFAC